MKVGNNFTIFAGQNTAAQRNQDVSDKQNQQQGRKTIFAGNLNMNQDKVMMRKQQAQKQAMKVVTDTWAVDRSIDEDLEARREHIRALEQEIGEAQKGLKDLEKQKSELMEEYGITPDSQEQKDLELLLKRDKAMSMGGIYISPEEEERLKELDQQAPTEYQQRSMDLVKQGDVYRANLKELEDARTTEIGTIKAIRQGRLSSDPMVKASAQADEILEAASKDIVGMLMEEAKEHIDEEQAKREEQAEEIKEKKEEEEEILEKRKEANEENEEITQNSPVEELVTVDKTGESIKKEIQNIVNKMNLVVEDIKGAAVDQNV